MYFPGSNIWFQSLIPLPIHNKWTVKNIEAYNKMLYNVCSISKVFYINLFDMFLSRNRFGTWLRAEQLYCNNVDKNGSINIHPNRHGWSLIARQYLSIIHSRSFNPIGY